MQATTIHMARGCVVTIGNSGNQKPALPVARNCVLCEITMSVLALKMVAQRMRARCVPSVRCSCA